MPEISLRAATPDDLELLLHWQRQAHVIEAGAGEDWHWQQELQRDPDAREQLIAARDGRPLGFVQIIDPAREDSHYWGEVPANLRALDIWLGAVTDHGRGYGSEIMRQVLNRCFEDSRVVAVLVDPLKRNQRAHRFYRRFGFAAIEDRRLGDDDCRVFRLERSTWRDLSG